MTMINIHVKTIDNVGDAVSESQYAVDMTMLEDSQTLQDAEGFERVVRGLFVSMEPAVYSDLSDKIEGNTVPGDATMRYSASFEYTGTTFNIKSLVKQRDFDGAVRGVRLELVEE